MNGAGHTQLCRHTDHRAGHISTGADGNVRTETGDNLLCTLAGGCQIPQRLGVAFDVFQGQLPLKPCHVDKLNGIPCLGNELCLHAVGCPCKEKFRPGIVLLDDGRKGKRRVDVSSGAAAGQ